MKIQSHLFNAKEIDLIKVMSDIAIDFNEDYSEDELIKMSDDAMDYFLSNGLRPDEEPNEIGLICEDIIDKLHDTFGI